MNELDNSEICISKMMAKALRHHPEEFGIELDERGWADVDALMAGIRSRGIEIDRPLLEKIIRQNNKRRFVLSEDGKHIQAAQGHSIRVDVEMQEAVPPSVLYHGTPEKNCPSIEREGLLPMKRLYVHLSKDITTAQMVAKRRRGPSAIYQVDTAAMILDGCKFWISKNGVWQAKAVPPKYLTRIQ